MINYCIDCKHCRPQYDQKHRCHHESVIEHDVVTGFALYRTCEYVRVTSGKCGMEGKMWEAREPLAISCYNKLVRFFKPKLVKGTDS